MDCRAAHAVEFDRRLFDGQVGGGDDADGRRRLGDGLEPLLGGLFGHRRGLLLEAPEALDLHHVADDVRADFVDRVGGRRVADVGHDHVVAVAGCARERVAGHADLEGGGVRTGEFLDGEEVLRRGDAPSAARQERAPEALDRADLRHRHPFALVALDDGHGERDAGGVLDALRRRGGELFERRALLRPVRGEFPVASVLGEGADGLVDLGADALVGGAEDGLDLFAAQVVLQFHAGQFGGVVGDLAVRVLAEEPLLHLDRVDRHGLLDRGAVEHEELELHARRECVPRAELAVAGLHVLVGREERADRLVGGTVDRGHLAVGGNEDEVDADGVLDGLESLSQPPVAEARDHHHQRPHAPDALQPGEGLGALLGGHARLGGGGLQPCRELGGESLFADVLAGSLDRVGDLAGDGGDEVAPGGRPADEPGLLGLGREHVPVGAVLDVQDVLGDPVTEEALDELELVHRVGPLGVWDLHPVDTDRDAAGGALAQLGDGLPEQPGHHEQ